MDEKKILLSEKEMPTQWYNLQADLPKPLDPPIHPGTKQPITPDMLAPIFPMELIKQEVSAERWIDIPEEVQEIYKIWRPSPLTRADRLEKFLDTPAKIYFKNESLSPPGSHKPNTAVAQAYYNKKEGVKRLVTETGAGQWGSALSFACKYFGLGCLVFMVRISYDQKPYRRSLMQVWGSEVFASPSNQTEFGKKVLAENPDSLGSLGIAISEAIEVAAKNDDTKYALGSVLNHVLLHQTVTGLETKKQFEKIDEYPDILVGCTGGGSNYAGLMLPYMPDKLSGKKIRMIAVEPAACPTFTKGKFAYDFGDTAGQTPLLKMYTLGSTFVPPGIHAGGLRYHGMAPLLSAAMDQGWLEVAAPHQNPVFESAIIWAQTEGIVPAPETAHAVRVVIDEAIKCKESGEKKTIVILFSGHGHFDLSAYDAYLAKKLEDYEYPIEKVEEAMKHIPQV